MADRHFASSPATPKTQGGTAQCPRIAELIEYALGQASSDERRRVEAHLQHDDCGVCRGWVETAQRFRAEPCPGGSLTAAGAAGLPTVSDATPIPPSARFQRHALGDLEQRLRLLEDNG